MRSTRFLFSLLAVTLCFAPLALAQITNVTNDQATPIHGVGHDYISMLSETVSPANGQVSVRINAPVPKGRKLNMPYAWLYSSSGVHYVAPNQIGNGSAVWWTGNSGSGWTDSSPLLTAIQGNTSVYNPNGAPPTTYTCTFISNYVFQDPAGTRHSVNLSIGQTTDQNTHCTSGQLPQIDLVGGDDFFSAVTNQVPGGGIPTFPQPVTITGLDGTTYYFSHFSTTSLPPNVLGFFASPDYIKDRNGNMIQWSSSSGGTVIHDDVGRSAISISPISSSTNTISISGISNPFALAWGSSPANFSVNYVQIPTGLGSCGVLGSNQLGTGNVQTLTLPNGQSYQFQYDPTYGLLSKITYPDGGYVSYTWGVNPLSEFIQLPISGPTSGSPVCYLRYDLPAITHRYVSFDGVHIALQQDFSYSTTWDSTYVGTWDSKQTTVTTHDLIRNPNQSFQTIYAYAPVWVSGAPNTLGGGQTAVESAVTYQDFSGNTLRSVTKAWFDQFLLGCELTILDNNQIFGIWNARSSLPTDEKEYDYGLITSASACKNASGSITPPSGITSTRETVINYAIFDRPSQVITYGNGTRVAETDFDYDQTAVAAVPNLPAGTHDETSYGTSFNKRGNATTVTRKCLQTCADPVTTFTYDETGQALTTTDPRGNVTQFSYTDNYAAGTGTPPGNTNAYVKTVTGPVANGVSHTSTFQYGYADGQLRSTIDENSQTTSYQYNDPFLRPTQINSPDGGQTIISYNDAAPSPSVTTTRKINSTQSIANSSTMDGMGHVVKTLLVSDPDCTSGDRTDTTYTGLGQVYTVSNPYCIAGESTSGLTTFTYDALGRATQVAHPDGTTVLTTYTGRATQVQDEGNGNGTQRVTRISQSDGLGRLSTLCEVASGPFVGAGGSSSSSLIGSSGAPVACGQDITGTGFLTTYQYDTLSNLLQVNQTGIAPRTFTYDSLSRLLTASNPESGAISYTYDANGNLQTKTAPAPNQTGTATVATSYQYDALNRLTQKSYNDGMTPTVANIYDASSNCGASYYLKTTGRLVFAGVPGWSFCYGYDSMGRLADKDLRMSVPAGLNYLDYSYDLLGNITSQTAGYGAAYYTYNTAGRLLKVTSSYSDANNPATLFSAAQYNAFGGLTQDTLGDNETETYSYVPKLARLQSYTAKLNTTTLYNFNIATFAPNGDILAANDTANGNWTYTYDPFNRLVGSNKNSGQSVFSYVYDRFGNRWQQNGPNAFLATFTGNNPSAPQNNNRMDGYSYDSAGNLLNDGTHGYTYDAENRLIKVDNGSTATYSYDPDGNRVQKIQAAGNYGDPAGTWQFLYDQSGHMIQRYDGTLWQGNVYAGARHLAVQGGGTFFIHSDWLGTVRVRNQYTNPAFIETCLSLPFGDGFSCPTQYFGDFSPLHFTGKEHDFESGLDYFGARFDASSMGRFMTPDEVSESSHPGNPQSWNLYAYVQNNPVNMVDPDGRDCVYLDNSGGTNPNGPGGATIDHNSNKAECDDHGGRWANGTVEKLSWVTPDPESDSVRIFSHYRDVVGTTWAGPGWSNGDKYANMISPEGIQQVKDTEFLGFVLFSFVHGLPMGGGIEDDEAPRVQLPVGSRRFVLDMGPEGAEALPPTNQATMIGGRMYSGHALDGMQEAGLVPTVVEEVIAAGAPSAGRSPGTTAHTAEGITVVTNQSGKVVTVFYTRK